MSFATDNKFGYLFALNNDTQLITQTHTSFPFLFFLLGARIFLASIGWNILNRLAPLFICILDLVALNPSPLNNDKDQKFLMNIHCTQ